MSSMYARDREGLIAKDATGVVILAVVVMVVSLRMYVCRISPGRRLPGEAVKIAGAGWIRRNDFR